MTEPSLATKTHTHASPHVEPPIARFTWVIWPWMNWIVPAFVCLHGLSGNGGWESLLLIYGAVLIVPAFALLGSLPRFLLRKRGYRSAPLTTVPLLFVIWWGWTCVGAAMPGITDSSPLPSIANSLTGERLPSAIELMLMVGGMLAGTIAWIAVVAMSIALSNRARAGRAPSRPSRAGVIVAWVAAVAIPAALIVICVVGVQLGVSATDADGDTQAVAAARGGSARDELDQQRYTTMQEALSEVRGLISATDWTGAQSGTVSGTCPWVTQAADCYALDARFVFKAAEEPDFTGIAETLQSSGWATESVTTDQWGARELDVHSPDGVSVTIRYSTVDGQGFINTRAKSSSWWGSRYDVRVPDGAVDEKQMWAADDFPLR
jgi:hypothetical protein